MLVNITTNPETILPINKARVVAQFQNTGNKPVYIVKQKLFGTPRVPSSTNYDFVLQAENKLDIVDVTSIARFDAVSTGNTTLAVMETVKV